MISTTRANSCGRETARCRNRTASVTLKTMVAPPIPIASRKIAEMVKPGLSRRARHAITRFYYHVFMLLLAAAFAIHLQAVSPTAPNRQPQIAVGNGTAVMVFGSGESIWVARSTDSGRSFSAAAKVAELPKLMLGRHRGPRVSIAGNAIVVSAIGSVSGDLVAWRSTDGGRT